MIHHTMITKQGSDPDSGWSYVQNFNSPIAIGFDRVETVLRAPGLHRRYVALPIGSHYEPAGDWPAGLQALSDHVREISAQGI